MKQRTIAIIIAAVLAALVFCGACVPSNAPRVCPVGHVCELIPPISQEP